MEAIARESVLVFTVEERRLALRVEKVDRVVRAVEVTPLPAAPPAILGIINVHGRVVPVASVRRRLGLSEREVLPGDCFILARTARRPLALVADSVEGIREFSPDTLTAADALIPGARSAASILKTSDGLVLIEDLEHFLSAEEDAQLTAALAK